MDRESWTEDAVINSAEWKHIRQLSSKTLEAFGWSHYERGAIILIFVRSLLLSGAASGIGRGNTCAELSYRSGGDALGMVELRTS
jgi:hypothetical protein